MTSGGDDVTNEEAKSPGTKEKKRGGQRSPKSDGNSKQKISEGAVLRDKVSENMRELSQGGRSPASPAYDAAEVDENGKRKLTMIGKFIKHQSVGRMPSIQSGHTTTMCERANKLASTLVKGNYMANFTALVVLFDAYLTCVDIDFRAGDEEVPRIVVELSNLCLGVYSLDFALFLYVNGICILKKIWKDFFTLIDVTVLLCGYVELALSLSGMGEFFGRLGILRLLRVARVLRLTRVLRKMTALKELRRLLNMMATCMKALAWSFLICFAVMTFWAMLMVEIVHPIIKLKGSEFFDDCEQCMRATSSVMDANLLLFKTVIAGDSWGQIAVPVIEENPETAIIFVGSQLTLVFGVLNLIVAVVVDTFAEAREQNVVDFAEELEQDMAMDQKSLQKIFDRIDGDGSGELTLAELIEGARQDPEFRSRLQVMDIDEVDLEQLFEMIDIEGCGLVKQAEFIDPLSRWVRDSKTAPRFVKYNMMRLMRRQEEFVASVDARFDLLACRIDEMTEVLRHVSQLPRTSGKSSHGMYAFTEYADSYNVGSEFGPQMTKLFSIGSSHAQKTVQIDADCPVSSSREPVRGYEALGPQVRRMNLRHRERASKDAVCPSNVGTATVELEAVEELIEQPPSSNKQLMPCLHQDADKARRTDMAAAFRKAVEVMKESLVEAAEHALQKSLVTADISLQELSSAPLTLSPPASPKSLREARGEA
mmetsp:Transcript_36812/g.85042  ORF Transcript_36812/g.85042 Transcript_36812/m.85042 type:complete len:709 (-) Transcript_36812:130-2256(-)